MVRWNNLKYIIVKDTEKKDGNLQVIISRLIIYNSIKNNCKGEINMENQTRWECTCCGTQTVVSNGRRPNPGSCPRNLDSRGNRKPHKWVKVG